MATPLPPINMNICVTQDQLDVYNSHIYTVALFFNIFITILSFIVLFFAIRRLLSESIVQASIRIYLIMSILCCLVHQSAYLVLRIQFLYQVFFKLDHPCDLHYKASDCSPITFGLVTGNCGMCLVQSAMSIDRIISILIPRIYHKLKFYPGIFLSIAVLIGMQLTYHIIFLNDPLTDYVAHCGNLPPRSVGRFKVFLTVTFYLSIAHITINVFALIWNIWQDYKQRLVTSSGTPRKSFDVNERFNARAALKSTQAIFLLSMSQFILTFIYSVLTEIFLEMQPRITVLQYSLALALIYSSPYTCILIPLLIILALSYIKNQRHRNINAMTSQKETQEDHMKKMRKLWG